MGATSVSVPSVPLGFNRREKNVALLKPLRLGARVHIGLLGCGLMSERGWECFGNCL